MMPNAEAYFDSKCSSVIASVIVEQSSSLLNICTFKMKSNTKHFQSLRMAPKHAELQIFIQANITVEKKLETCHEQPHLDSGRFIKVFYKTTTCPQPPLLSSPISSRLIQVSLYFFYNGFPSIVKF